jgi:SAM-dependent methyltransferase
MGRSDGRLGERMRPKPHYVADYEAFVSDLIRHFSMDEAMSHAVGGDYLGTGKKERAILEYVGLRDGMKIVDIGCGSGRLSSVISDMRIDYLGIDVVDDLLAYAAKKSSPKFAFVRHTELTVPVADETVDIACAFSVFTHLRHEESYLYAKDVLRALKPGGVFVFSLLEFGEPHHWPVFEQTVAACAAGTMPHINTFLERPVIRLWAKHLGYKVAELVDGLAAPWNEAALGQTTAILKKPVTS